MPLVVTRSALKDIFAINTRLELLAAPNRFPLAFKPFGRNPVAAF
jgi:hypothetical protein